MGFQPSEKVVALNARVEAFMQKHIYPRELEWEEFTHDQNNQWQVTEWFDGLREKAGRRNCALKMCGCR
jgi:acyl-CoA dehydrogenase